MNPHQQHLASIANLLAYIDGSITGACVQCGEIFKLGPGARRMFCEPCQCEREANACCAAPSYRTIASSETEDGMRFSTVVCDSCGQRKEIEL